MITSMHIQNFKCFKDFKIDLDPFTVLIGPNESGKTAFLQAIRLMGAVSPGLARHVDSLAGLVGGALRTEIFWRNDGANPLAIQAELRITNDPLRVCSIKLESEAPSAGNFHVRSSPVAEAPASDGSLRDLTQEVTQLLGSISYYCFSPAALRQPAPLSDQMFGLSPTGEGFPSFLDDISRADTASYIALKKEFCNRFREYKGIILGKQKDTRPVALKLEFVTRHDETLPAGSISDGALLSLAFLAVLHQPSPPGILLIEEPENGVHHARLEEIVEALREMNRTKDVQVILTTHSPYLLDLAEPEEVRVFAKDDEGAVHQKRLSDYPEVESLKKHFMSGEIWSNLSEQDFVLQGGSAE